MRKTGFFPELLPWEQWVSGSRRGRRANEKADQRMGPARAMCCRCLRFACARAVAPSQRADGRTLIKRTVVRPDDLRLVRRNKRVAMGMVAERACRARDDTLIVSSPPDRFTRSRELELLIRPRPRGSPCHS